ncbi:response regulator [Oceaniglobus ichthyenteri]|uniref:response regulator n=1 Tax=Oceaniglobus ichthyenteri TaxID=2136177 RepID=UPI000D358B94|nr:response regulator [Oceaniglobus ichthyenteri]
MPDMHDEFLFPFKPTAARPLLGQTVLIVEDSRFASEAMRLMCLRCGARIRRADTLAAAARHLRVYRPSVAIIDMGLPDGSGRDLIEELAKASPRIPALLATSGDPDMRDKALQAGADAFLEKPMLSVGEFLEAVLARLPRDSQPKGPRPVLEEYVQPDLLALQDDLSHVSDLLGSADNPARMKYVTGFLSGIARSIGDRDLTGATEKLSHLSQTQQPTGVQISIVSAMVHDRLKAQPIAI